MPRRPQQPLDAAAGRSRALRALGRREHSARELESKLSALGVEDADAAGIVDELKTHGWQSDSRYAELLTRSRISQGYGPLRIRAELAARGVEQRIIGEVLAQADCDWFTLATDICRKRFGGAVAEDAATARKRWSFLANRGFEAEQIRAALKCSSSESDE